MNQLQSILPQVYQESALSLAVTKGAGSEIDELYQVGVGQFDIEELDPDYLCVLSGIFSSPLYKSYWSDESKVQLSLVAYTDVWPLRGTKLGVENILTILADNGDVAPSWDVRQFGDTAYPGLVAGEWWVTVPISEDYRNSPSWITIQDVALFNGALTVTDRSDNTGISYDEFYADYSCADEPVWS